MKTVFEYLDYRKYLADRVIYERQLDKKWSYRKMAALSGIDPGTFTRMLYGQRKISRNLALKIAAALKFGKKETRYFVTLVQFSDAKAENKKEECFHELLHFRENKAAVIEQNRYRYFEEWYYMAVRELLNFFPFSGNLYEIAQAFDPPLKKKEAQKAVELLESLGMVVRGDDGYYHLTDTFVTTGEEWQSVVIHDLQRKLLDLARKALDIKPKEERDFSSLTLSLSPEGFASVKEKLKEFRKLLFALAKDDRNVNGVYQINFQAFPLTAVVKNGPAKKHEVDDV